MMNRALELGQDLGRLTWDYLHSWTGGTDDARFADVAAYCMFIGYPRSGHSIIGALLDAHPHAVIAHEMGALQYVHAKFDRQQLYHLLDQKARLDANNGRRSGSYSYRVPGQWQGRAQQIRVIGDNQAEGATLRLRARPWLWDRVQSTTQTPVHLVHVTRNPFDNITTIAQHAANEGIPDLEAAAEHYFSLCETVLRLKEHVDSETIIDVSHEEFVADPSASLRTLCRFLGLEPLDDYLDACAKIVYDTPHKSRYEGPWNKRLRQMVQRRMGEIPYLRHYEFEDGHA